MSLQRLAPCLLLLPLFTTSAARADDARSIEIARKSHEAGIEQYTNGDIEGARISFAQSLAAWPALETMKALAIAELETEHFLDAINHFKLYAKDKHPKPEFLKKLPKYIEECNQHLGHLRIIAPPGSGIAVDGHRVFDLREPLDVMPGTHSVTMREPAPSETRTIDVAVTQTVDVVFARDSSASTPALSTPAQSSQRTASSNEGFWTTRHKWAVGLGAGAVVTASVGAGFGIAAIGKHSSLNDLAAEKDGAFCTRSPATPYCTQLSSAVSTQRSDAHISTIAFGVSSALLISAVVLLVWPQAQDQRSARAWFVPSVVQHGGAVFAGGNF